MYIVYCEYIHSVTLCCQTNKMIKIQHQDSHIYFVNYYIR